MTAIGNNLNHNLLFGYSTTGAYFSTSEICKHCEKTGGFTTYYAYCINCDRHQGNCNPSKLDCHYCQLKFKLQNIRIEQNRINNALNKIFGSDVENLLLFLNNRITSKYLIIEILEGYSWAEEFTSYRLLQLVK